MLGTYSIYKSWASGWLSGDCHASILSAHQHCSSPPQLTPAASAHSSGAISFNTPTATPNFQFYSSSNAKLALDSFLLFSFSDAPSFQTKVRVWCIVMTNLSGGEDNHAPPGLLQIQFTLQHALCWSGAIKERQFPVEECAALHSKLLSQGCPVLSLLHQPGAVHPWRPLPSSWGNTCGVSACRNIFGAILSLLHKLQPKHTKTFFSYLASQNCPLTFPHHTGPRSEFRRTGSTSKVIGKELPLRDG